MDSAGKDVAPTSSRSVTDYESIHGHVARDVQPGQIMWLSWNLDDWSDISRWGFSLRPGSYTILAIPIVSGELPNPDTQAHFAVSAQGKFVTDGKTINSNRVTIQVTP
jgi:hypothetical protein